MQDLNPSGAVGNAQCATAEKGQQVIDAAARSLVDLFTDIDGLPATTLRR
jgi:creatinine amidohydrolase